MLLENFLLHSFISITLPFPDKDKELGSNLMIKWLCDTDANPDKLRNSNHDFEGLWLTVREWLAFAILAMFIMKPSSAAPLLDRINPNNSESVNSWSLSQIRILLNAFFVAALWGVLPSAVLLIGWFHGSFHDLLADKSGYLRSARLRSCNLSRSPASWEKQWWWWWLVMVVIKMMVIQKCYETYDIII